MATRRTEPIWVVSEERALAAALAAALEATGWSSVEVVRGGRLRDVARSVVGLAKLVLVADANGRLPDPRPALVGHHRPYVVAVGDRTALPALADAVERLVAVAALDAAQPFTDLVRALDHHLSGSAGHVDPAALLAALRDREREARLFETLTDREREVLGAMIVGLAASEVAGEWRVSLATVRSHIRAVLSKVGVRSQLAAVALAWRSCREPPVTDEMRRAHQF